MSIKVPIRRTGLADVKSRELFKRAVFKIFTSSSPTNGQLRELGREAAVAVGRKRPWTSRHLYNLLHYTRYTINPLLFEYVTRRAGLTALNGAHKVEVLVRGRVRAGALVLLNSRKCRRKRCPIHFVPDSPARLYCSDDCRQRAAISRRLKPKSRR